MMKGDSENKNGCRQAKGNSVDYKKEATADNQPSLEEAEVLVVRVARRRIS